MTSPPPANPAPPQPFGACAEASVETGPGGPRVATAPGRSWLAGRIGSQCRVCLRWQRAPFCGQCLAQYAAPRPRCATCAIAVTQGDRQCAACRLTAPPLNAAFAAVDYAYPWDQLIARFKFRDAVELARPLSDRMGPGLAAALDAGQQRPELILPVPLTTERLRERGYNQAWELARRLGRQLGLPARVDCLERVIGGAHQADLHGHERRRQVRGAYALTTAGVAAVAGRHIAVVDDVMTTGATLGELALTLRRGGAASVQAWVLARTPE